jgi:hypothetical protein
MDRVSLPINFLFAFFVLAAAFGSGGCAKTKAAESYAMSEERTAREHSLLNVLQSLSIDSIVFEHKPDAGDGMRGEESCGAPGNESPEFPGATFGGAKKPPARIAFYGVKQNTKAEIEQEKNVGELKNSSTAKTSEETPGMAETVKAGGEAGKSVLQEIKWILIIAATILAMALIWKFALEKKR